MNDEDRDPHFGHSCLQTTERRYTLLDLPNFQLELFLLFSSRLSSVPLQLLVPAIRAFPGHSYGRHHWFCYDSTSLFEGQTATATGHRRKVSSVSEGQRNIISCYSSFVDSVDERAAADNTHDTTTLEGCAAQVIDLCHAFFDAQPNSLSEPEFVIAISPFLAANYNVDGLASSRSQAVSLCVECNAFLAGLASDTSSLARVTHTQHPWRYTCSNPLLIFGLGVQLGRQGCDSKRRTGGGRKD